jgi:hypothetical protein
MSNVGATRRLCLVLGVLACLATLQAPFASAGIGWCRTDPHVRIAGKDAHIFVSSPKDVQTSATGPVAVVITVPEGVSTELISVDDGFGHGWDVRFRQSGDLRVTDSGEIQIVAETYVPASDTLVVETTLTDGSGAQIDKATNTTNKWVTVRGRL